MKVIPSIFFGRRLALAMLMLVPLVQGAEPVVDCFRLRAPGGAYALEQGSDLQYGRLGEREGLWVVCDRNGRQSAAKIYLIRAETLRAAKPDQPIIADEEFVIVAPNVGWAEFKAANQAAGDEVLADLQRRVTPAEARGDEPYLDLEAVTIAPSPVPPHAPRLFVVAEEPYSAILELELAPAAKGLPSQPTLARLAAVYAYAELPAEQGSARNDGIEGLAWSEQSKRFYFAEEATAKLNDEPRWLALFSLDPRLGSAQLTDGQVRIDREVSDALTAAIRKCRRGRMQTLNALTALPDGRLLAVDRNGGWIDLVDPAARTAGPWLNLYELNGQNLRTVLANFPAERKMPYISIEGLAFDPAGALWLIDDPAMPEGWRESALIRLTGLPPLPSPGGAATRPKDAQADPGSSQ